MLRDMVRMRLAGADAEGCPGTGAWQGPAGAHAGLLAVMELLLDGRVEVGVSQVDIGDELAEQVLGTLQTALEGLYILRGRISPPI